MQWDRMNYGKGAFYNNKRYFEVSYKMKDLFTNLSESSSKLFADIIQRTAEIQQKLNDFRVDVWSVFEAENTNKYLTWDKVNDEQKAIYLQKTLAKRQKLINEVPDLEEYFVWTACKTKPIYPEISKPASSVKTPKMSTEVLQVKRPGYFSPLSDSTNPETAKIRFENLFGKKDAPMAAPQKPPVGVSREHQEKILAKFWEDARNSGTRYSLNLKNLSTDGGKPSTKSVTKSNVNQGQNLDESSVFPFANRLNITLEEQKEIAKMEAQLRDSKVQYVPKPVNPSIDSMQAATTKAVAVDQEIQKPGDQNAVEQTKTFTDASKPALMDSSTFDILNPPRPSFTPEQLEAAAAKERFNEASKSAPQFVISVLPQDAETRERLEAFKLRLSKQNESTKSANATVSAKPKDYQSEYMWLLDDADMQAFQQYVDSVPSMSTDATLNRQLLWKSFKQLSDSELNDYYKSFNKTRSNVAGVVTNVDDMDAILEPIYSKKIIGDADLETKTFIAYCDKMRPQLLLEPGMAWKRSFQLNLILSERFEKLDEEELNNYRWAAERINQIQRKLNTTPVTAFASFVAYSIVKNGSSETWESLSKANQNCYEQRAKMNRQMLHLLYDDLEEFFQWTNRSKLVEEPKDEMGEKVSKVTTPTTSEFLGLNEDKTTSKIAASARTNNSTLDSTFIAELLEGDNSLFGKSSDTTAHNAAVYKRLFAAMDKSKTPESRNLTKLPFEFHFRESTSAGTEASRIPGAQNPPVPKLETIYPTTLAKVESPGTKPETTEEPVKCKLFKYQKSYFELAYMNENVFHTRRTPWTTHDYMLYTNPVDNAAFEKFANLAHTKKPKYDGNKLWKKWLTLKPEIRESYYRMAFQTAAVDDADALFILEKQTIENNGSKECAAERRKLQQEWSCLSEKERQVYVAKAFNNFLEDDKNPEKRFQKWEAYRDSFISRASSIDNVDAKLVVLPPFNHVIANTEKCAFILYLEDVRSEFLKLPEMAQKRYWEVSFILKDQWNVLTTEEQQPYFDTVDRYLQIRKHLHEWKLSAKDVYIQNRHGRVSFDNLDAEAKKRYGEVALRNRMILLKKYPDLHQFYIWIVPKPNAEPNALAKSLTADAENGNAVEKDAEEKTETSPNDDSVWYSYVDDLDRVAFEKYRDTVRTMTSDYVDGTNVWWQEFVNFTDQDRKVYYDQATNDRCLKKACASFASDFSRVAKNSIMDKAYAKESTQLHRTWECLSAPAKQYYIDIAKEELLERQKKNAFDWYYSNESHYDFGKYSMSTPGVMLSVKRVYIGGITTEQKAVMLYLKHHEKELLKEPGMSNKRQFQLALIMGQRFKNLSDEERQPYFDIVNRIKKIHEHINKFPINAMRIYQNKTGDISKSWNDVSDEQKVACKEVAKLNTTKLSKEFPDVGTYFHWVVNDGLSKKSTTNTITFVPKELLVENKATEDASAEVESSDPEEVVNDSTNAEKDEETTLTNDAEPTTPVIPETVPQKDASLELHVEPTVTGDASEESDSEGNWEIVNDDANIQKEEETTSTTDAEPTTAVIPDAVLPEDISLEPRSLEPTITVDTSEDSDPENSWEVIDDEDEASSKPDNTEDTEATEDEPEANADANKTPTAFMFYKKAMRRLNADENFGKKDNDLQRQALISDWNKLSDEDKAVYFEKERLARIQLEKQ
uniref:HMG box domain-containing protein n=1 Tax=Panagrellus redivivus TaxID=6233 RepID=A0A7E4W273_PANRE